MAKDLPRHMGHYLLEEKLGSGGMGVVYRAIDTLLDRPVAIKMMHAAEQLDDDASAAHVSEMGERFLREAKAAAKIKSRNVVHVLQLGTNDDGDAYMVMELLVGARLSKVMTRGGGMKPARAVHIAVQICHGMQAAHDLGIVHRDLKPANVMLVEEDGQVDVAKILDFGVAKVQDDGARQGLTQAGVLLGTLPFMAPEQFTGKPVDARTDIYALGIILYRMFTGLTVWDAESLSDIVRHQLSSVPASMFERVSNAEFTPIIDAVVLKCLEKDPARRWQSMRELAAALEAGLQAPKAVSANVETAIVKVPMAPPLSAPAPAARLGPGAEPTTLIPEFNDSAIEVSVFATMPRVEGGSTSQQPTQAGSPVALPSLAPPAATPTRATVLAPPAPRAQRPEDPGSVSGPHSLVGRLIAGRYEVVKKLNQGGVGVVYLAMQRPLDRPVALKVLLKKHADDETALRRFEKEAAAVARLAHAHIVMLYDFGHTENGDLYIAMEYLQGQSLRDLLDAAGFVPWERSLHIIQGMCRALVAAHTQNMVHRDLKPENVMLVESNGDLDFAKVLDFGLARSIESHQPAITRHDVIPGTPAYMSPERANGISNDPRSDLYALGAVWFELLTGEAPFPGEVSIKVILRHIHEAPRRPSFAQPKNPIPPFIDAIVLELLEKAPEHRPASAQALLDRLDVLARPSGWHVGRTHDVGRRGQHDSALQSFAADAGRVSDGETLSFSVEEGEPLPLVKKKPRPALIPDDPVLLTRKKPTSAGVRIDSMPPPTPPPPISLQTPRQPTQEFLRPPVDEHLVMTVPQAAPRIESLAQVVGWLSTAKTARSVGELCCAFLVTRFDRALVVDMRGVVPLASATASGQVLSWPPIVYALPRCQGILELATRTDAYYGPPIVNADWMPWYGSLGGSAPGAMFVGGLQREGHPAFLFYADHRDAILRPRVKDAVALLREAAVALSAVGDQASQTLTD